MKIWGFDVVETDAIEPDTVIVGPDVRRIPVTVEIGPDSPEVVIMREVDLSKYAIIKNIGISVEK